MDRNTALELLKEYTDFLLREGYVDCDVWCEPPTTIDQFILKKWFKEKFPIKK